ncbi:uncharacterized protein B0H64DRAFT_1932 [Chaetomium fimeti]|uniref:Uncharacterized protein n=1 Tax=Chaetomium fimeti TaxID=1854472 RepID=A0AAE0HQD7_9PEZI|nr:hypothetical protein B0H64DRAFT_1932 [Chaetomium fimeti]
MSTLAQLIKDSPGQYIEVSGTADTTVGAEFSMGATVTLPAKDGEPKSSIQACLLLMKIENGYLKKSQDIKFVGRLGSSVSTVTATKEGGDYKAAYDWQCKISEAGKYRFHVTFKGTLPTNEEFDVMMTTAEFTCKA